MTQFILYLLRWQLSSPILALTMRWLDGKAHNSFKSACVANLIGGCIFFWVDKLIFKI